MWSKQYVKARKDMDQFYNQGKVQLGKTNITRDIAAQHDLLYIPDPGLKLLE